MKHPWIETHVHLFNPDTDDRSALPELYGTGSLHTSKTYLKALGEDAPQAVVVVDFSGAATSEHVMSALIDLKRLGVDARGVIKADIYDPRTFDWIRRDDVCGIRLYAKNAVPDLSVDKEKWHQLFNILRHGGKHLVVFGGAQYLQGLIGQLPEDLPLLIDHLGLPDAAQGINEKHFASLLQLAHQRNQSAGAVYFKGPGYRTAMDPEAVAPFVTKIVQTLGSGRLLLGTTDGPFAGPVIGLAPEDAGKQFNEVMDYPRVLSYIESLIQYVAEQAGLDLEGFKRQVLHTNATHLYKL
jgi:predicted TIM-barrel fold metal-dependent hydrolase